MTTHNLLNFSELGEAIGANVPKAGPFRNLISALSVAS
jgi:hypothetical protein